MFLGIDTSNYTTSLALVDSGGALVREARKILDVPENTRGLRQSEALFQHVKNLPVLSEELMHDQEGDIRAIGVSVAPTTRQDSYMPVFLAGKSLASSMASLTRIPLYPLSHQENHLWAGISTAKGPSSESFLAVHLSGGTTDLLKVRISANYRMTIETLASSSDLHAGQFVDRIGVQMGLPFPAGPGLERLAEGAQGKLRIPSAVTNGKASFSGPLAATKRLLTNNSKADIAKAVLICIARSVHKMIAFGLDQTRSQPVLIVGGVAANQLIRQELVTRLPGIDLYFAAPRYSVDNGLGAALFGGLAHCGEAFYGNILS